MIFPELTQKIENKTEGIFEYVYNGKVKLMSFKQSTETGWKPSVTYDKEIAYSFLDKQMKQLVLMASVMLILSIAIMIVLIKKLLRPVDYLNHVIKDLSSAEGDLRQRLEASSRDEFGQVSGNINKFIEKLHEIY